jgi:hypothetical protein
VVDANVIVKTSKGFERYLPRNAHVTLGVEMHWTAIGHDLASGQPDRSDGVEDW